MKTKSIIFSWFGVAILTMSYSQNERSIPFNYIELPTSNFFEIRLEQLGSFELDSTLVMPQWWPDKATLKDTTLFLEKIGLNHTDQISKIDSITLNYYDYDFWEESEHLAIHRMKVVLSIVERSGIPLEKVNATIFHAVLKSHERHKYLGDNVYVPTRPFLRVEVYSRD